LKSELSEAQNVIQQIREKEDRPRPINEKEETDTVKNNLLENGTTFVHLEEKIVGSQLRNVFKVFEIS
jgi:hypothetical protein